MDRKEKIKLLTRAAQYDLCTETRQGLQSPAVQRESLSWNNLTQCLFPAALPGGRYASLLKILQSTYCENDCSYCANRRSRDVRREEISPDHLAATFSELVRRGVAEGLFLSSGVCRNTTYSMQRMIATVELLRFKYHFAGYVHLKLLPGCEESLVERAVQIADRVSANVEAPNAERLRFLSGDKILQSDLLQPMEHAKRFRDRGQGAKSGLTTQYVVGAAGESDREILTSVDQLYRQIGLARAFFSAFSPVRGTPLENLPPASPMRQHRLYQSDFLLRSYQFELSELALDASGNLPLDTDPKMAWARLHPELYPVEVNRASKGQLLRVPGIGPTSAERILRRRRLDPLKQIENLRSVGAVAERASAYVLLNGQQPARQLKLW